MNKRIGVFAAVLAVAGFVGLQGCDNRSDLEKNMDKAGNNIQEGVNDAGRGIKDATD